MQKLTVSIETFSIMVLDLVKSGVTYEAQEVGGNIVITFTGGY